jgi:hypothetical protein
MGRSAVRFVEWIRNRFSHRFRSSRVRHRSGARYKFPSLGLVLHPVILMPTEPELF